MRAVGLASGLSERNNGKTKIRPSQQKKNKKKNKTESKQSGGAKCELRIIVIKNNNYIYIYIQMNVWRSSPVCIPLSSTSAEQTMDLN